MAASDAGPNATANAAKSTGFIAAPGERTIVIARTFDAPRRLVFEVYTDPKHIPHWWGPAYLTTTVEKMDVRPGGEWRIVQRAPDGQEFAFHGEYREVMPPERIVATFEFEGTPGYVVVNTTTFEERDGKTKLTTTSLFQTVEHREEMMKSGMESGATESMERLAGVLAGMSPRGVAQPREREVVITRIFDAPRELVFEAWIDPKHLARWWGPKTFTNPVCEVDARVGGAWHIVMRGPDGSEYPCGGVYREIVKPERLVFTNIATDKEGKPILDGLTTVLFAEHGGKTKLTLQTRAVALVEYAVAYLAGMEAGWTQSLEKLAEQFAKS